jgi:hypothetical protein
MNLSEHERAILAIEALAQRIGENGEALNDQILINIASNLQLFMIAASVGDLGSLMDHINSFREKKIRENNEEIEDIRRELETGKRVTPTEKIARMKLGTDN